MRRLAPLVVLVGLAVALGLAAPSGLVAPAPARPLPGAARCAIFPGDSPWNQRVDGLPVARDSDVLIRAIGADRGLHADFGSGRYDGAPIGIPITVVGARQRRSRVRFAYAGESDRGPYPIPRRVRIEGGAASSGDRHAIIVDRDRCRLYELYALTRAAGRWRAGSGAIWDLGSNALRPAGWTSADAAGLPILPGLARHDEVARGVIDHALRFTAPRTRSAYVFPARHSAGVSADPALPPMGLRVRLQAGFRLAGFPPQARVVLTALRRYGMLLADNGASWFVSGAPDAGWDNDDLRALGRVAGADLEVVDTRGLRP